MLFGSKVAKHERLITIVAALTKTPGQTQSELARLMGVHPSTIEDDLRKLEEEGILVQEDDRGRLSLWNE
ncbi:MAG: hypothetical protein GFH27_549319n133 [Chloroflexi bacterium AL-W]|nr:hypothetical protein [Chloroflexi bacterium AL-N1]NOK71296.1 hypothetical protein [Chloroflexi bacterium AL-N10]NOK77671.1 hypothetical protein [Chloroflexi bacterium AL-N5]NOK84522.1 hypothetical protein [Chloroflexi bacterium AL-W]NOK92973.1 hypothetical protein [Chloroflexi bacterium AL-N15]